MMSKNPFLAKRKQWTRNVREADRQVEREINMLRLRRHPWVRYVNGRAICDLCGGNGTVEHLLQRCPLWQEAWEHMPPAAPRALRDTDSLVEKTRFVRARRAQWGKMEATAPPATGIVHGQAEARGCVAI